ncbi:hypothetical protein [Ammoniphilus resinae]|uniref:Uncharacterized protein n=1 Tax=Ammoniphilus resinae TaxID=861532 RepID=A0ABS4GRG2_9BACL|nr:hypothetical protein [Ammoniphilus resinae]MBP1932870.1 hypothetical protein [Ammoniphilus resinae]
MFLLDKSAVEIWKMLIPSKYILFPFEMDNEELIFHYRDYIYFVQDDGAVVRMGKPIDLHKQKLEDLWQLLFYDRQTFDYDHHGIFSIGAILKHMGYMVPFTYHPHQTHLVEIVDLINPDQVYQIELNSLSFRFVLYQSLLYCDELNEQFRGETEFEIQQILRTDLSSVPNERSSRRRKL